MSIHSLWVILSGQHGSSTAHTYQVNYLAPMIYCIPDRKGHPIDFYSMSIQWSLLSGIWYTRYYLSYWNWFKKYENCICLWYHWSTLKSYILENRDILFNMSNTLGHYSLRKRRFTGIGIPIINLRRSDDRLRFIMGIPILIRRRFLSE